MKRRVKITYNSPVILTFVATCFIATTIGMFTNGKSTEVIFSTHNSSMLNPWTYIRFITHIFGHDGFDHFIVNSMYILLIGPMLEEKYGSFEIGKIILVTAIITGLIHNLLWENTYLCGASGIVFSFIILSSFTSFKEGEIPLSAILVLGIYFGKELLDMIFVVDEVSNLSHILGGVVGGLSGYFLNRKPMH